MVGAVYVDFDVGFMADLGSGLGVSAGLVDLGVGRLVCRVGGKLGFRIVDICGGGRLWV